MHPDTSRFADKIPADFADRYHADCSLQGRQRLADALGIPLQAVYNEASRRRVDGSNRRRPAETAPTAG